jgi:hypothetical protein
MWDRIIEHFQTLGALAGKDDHSVGGFSRSGSSATPFLCLPYNTKNKASPCRRKFLLYGYSSVIHTLLAIIIVLLSDYAGNISLACVLAPRQYGYDRYHFRART